MNDYYKKMIADEFITCVQNTIHRMEGEETYRPFHAALLSEEALFWSRFERSFSTSFGQRVIEEISRIAALSGGADDACRQKETYVEMDVGYLNAIDDHIQSLRDHRGHRDWESSLNEVKSARKTGHTHNVRVISDLWWTKDGINHYVSIKTVKPNIDQTAVAKKDILTLTLDDPRCHAYFGLYYNPYGENKLSYAHNPPMGIFDFRHDDVVLIGREYWDTLGGDGCYDEILNIAKEVGRKTRRMIMKMR